MQYFVLLSFLFISGIIQAQKNNQVTEKFVIGGDVKNNITFP